MPTKKSASANDGTFMAWTQITTWHGMYDTFNSNNRIMKCIWILAMLFTTYMSILQVTQLMLDFVTGSKWGTSTYEESPINGIVFPQVTICNFNLVSEQRMRTMNVSTRLVEYMMEGLAPFSNEIKWIPDNETRDSYEKIMQQQYFDLAGVYDYVDMKQWLRQLSPTCEQTIKQCSMGKGNKRQWFDCCSSVTEIFFGDYGRCFVLLVPSNISTNMVQDQAGTVNGMTLHLDPDLENYAPLDVQTDQDAGFRLGLGYDPEYSIISSPVVLKPGSHSWIAMTAIEERTTFYGNGRPVLYDILAIGNPLSMFDSSLPCHPNAQLDVRSGPYLYETCIEDCFLKEIVKLCGCAPLNPTRDHIMTCDPPASQGCAAEFWQNRTTETAALHEEADRCIANCSYACTRRFVTVRNSATSWPAPRHVETVQKQLAVKEGKMPSEENVKNRVLVDIFFESTQIHVSEKSEQRTTVDLISNVGGNLGVWAGISVVTLFQAVVMFISVLRQTINRRIRDLQNVGHKVAKVGSYEINGAKTWHHPKSRRLSDSLKHKGTTRF